MTSAAHQNWGWLFPLLLIPLLLSSANANAQSVFPEKPADQQAVTVQKARLQSRSAAKVLQEAINRVHQQHHYGIVLIPEGTYKLKEQVYLWKGIRLTGYGNRRPEFVLPKQTEGYSDTAQIRYMVQFCDERPEKGEPIRDAANTTFYSGINNINFTIAEGNPGAAAVRFRVAQHSSLENIRFTLKSGYAAVHHIGNELENCTFSGGRYGIVTQRTSPGWPVLLLNNHFKGQKNAAIKTHEAGLTCISCTFSEAPHVAEVAQNQYEHLFMKQCRFSDISKSAITGNRQIHPRHEPMFNPGLNEPYNHYMWIHLQDIHCNNVPQLLAFREKSNEKTFRKGRYTVAHLRYGFDVSDRARYGINTRIQIDKWQAPQEKAGNKPPRLPKSNRWVNVQTLGAKGNGTFDNTEILRRAIANYQTLYFPQGIYRITGSLKLRKHTKLIGLHPRQTILALPSRLPSFNNAQDPKPMLHVPENGNCIISGLGINPRLNNGAVGILWQGNAGSMLNDVLFGISEGVYRHRPKSQDQYCSLVVEKGGGHFKNFWSHDIIAKRGLIIRNTQTPGTIYQASVEHHAKLEVELDSIENWRFYGLQTEENLGSENAFALDIHACKNLEFGNLYTYRVMASKKAFPYAVKISESKKLEFKGVHNFSWGPNYFRNTFKIDKRFMAPNEIGYFRLH